MAKLLNVNTTTIFRAIANKRLEAATTPGGHYRIPREAVERFLRENNVSARRLGDGKRRVLIVEDNEAERRLYARTLSAIDNVEVRSVSSGYQAGFMTKSFSPDVIVLDLFLAEGDGRDVALLIRADESMRGTKIVVVTGSTDETAFREIAEIGVDAVLRKPIDAAALRGKIEELLPV